MSTQERALTDKEEKALAALLNSFTKKQAADRLGVNEVTIYRYLQDDFFCKTYNRLRRKQIDEAMQEYKRLLTVSVEALAEIIQDKNQDGKVRVSAISLVLNYYNHYERAHNY